MRILTEIEEWNLIESSFSFYCLQTTKINVTIYFLFLIPLNEDELAFFSDDLHESLVKSEVYVVTFVLFLRKDYKHLLFSLFLLQDYVEARDAI